MPTSATLRGRGAAGNPPNRFERLCIEPDPEAADPDAPLLKTTYFRDASRSIITYNESPDIPFRASLNPYRGCEHGCIYCYARPTHEYLGFSAGLDFETKIMVKEDAPELLRRALSSPTWEPQMVAISGVTDPYQPIERRLKITRRCLEVFAEFRNPVGIVTKNALVTRDKDVLGEMAKERLAAVFLSITTLDFELSRKMEPRTAIPELRLRAIRELADAGVPAGVMVAPVIPGLTEHEMPGILRAAAAAGASFAGYVMLRLPHAVGPLFEDWLERNYPDRKNKVLNAVRSVRGGRLNVSEYGARMKGRGPEAGRIRKLFEVSCRKFGIPTSGGLRLATDRFRRPAQRQLSLFPAD
jgi:DNA repair photolyase